MTDGGHGLCPVCRQACNLIPKITYYWMNGSRFSHRQAIETNEGRFGFAGRWWEKAPPVERACSRCLAGRDSEWIREE